MIILDAFKSFVGVEEFGLPVLVKVPSEELVRERAYLLWESAGCPSGDGVEFWVRAERELVSE
jgi:hypothetical protein